MAKKSRKALHVAFGVAPGGLADLPMKVGSVCIARLVCGRARGCSHCFPHGPDTTNSRIGKKQRSWKRARRSQYRAKRAEPDAVTCGGE